MAISVEFRYGGRAGKPYRLQDSDELVVVRTHSRRALVESSLSRDARRLVDELEPVTSFAEAGVEIVSCAKATKPRSLRDQVRQRLKDEEDIRFAGRVLCDPDSGVPAVYTENLFVKFRSDCLPAECEKRLKSHGLLLKRGLEYARNAYFVAAEEGTGAKVFEVAGRLLEEELVDLCHPELVWETRGRRAFPEQWHLKKTKIDGKTVDAHANVEAAWELSQGEGTTIAIIDDGMDLSHEEFAGAGKVVAPRDVTRGTNDPRPGPGNNHGTACAGVACGNGLHGASGVAPEAKLLPIRLASGLGSVAEADAFIWAADHGADVISCSWGPRDGKWWQPEDPYHAHTTPLADSTRLAIEYAVRKGREGKGCVITWAAGNGNESVDNDGYASYEKVLAVAACNDSSKKSAYSDYGKAVWCAFPSNDGVASTTPGIWTADRTGAEGYNPGQSSRGDGPGNYTNSFGGTLSACPGAAGVAALVLARNPELRWDQVREILKRCCDSIDKEGGKYDASGHSRSYGYGRLNAVKAVELAAPPKPGYLAIHTAVQDVAINDRETSELAVAVGDRRPIKTVKINVDIEHTYLGDLVVQIGPPPATNVEPVTLHNLEGAGTDNLKTSYDLTTKPGLGVLKGKNPEGIWTLIVRDRALSDVGKIRSFSVELGF